MKTIMISIRPRHVADILNHKKSVEIRKTFPKEFLQKKRYKSYTVYIYCTKSTKKEKLYFSMFHGDYRTAEHVDHKHRILNGLIVAKFKLNRIGIVSPLSTKYWCEEACLSETELLTYLNGEEGYAWYIDDLEIFNKPMELTNFKRVKWEKCDVKDKNGLYQCDKCPYGNKYLYECNYEKPLKAAQSWCYVEDEL